MKHFCILTLLIGNCALAAQVPKSPYIAVVYRYADALIKTNRESHQLGQNDLRILYTLSELSNKPVYRDAADAQLKWALQDPARMSPNRPWMLWDRCLEIAPDASRVALGKTGSIRAFAAAYQHTRDESYLKRIESVLTPGKSPLEQIGVAIDAWGAASRVPQPLATKLRRFAQSQDQAFVATNQTNLNPRLAMLCVSRYENTGDIRYRVLFLKAADVYRKMPPEDQQMSPMTFGHIISLELAAWRSASSQEYLDSACLFAAIAGSRFWNVDAALPKVDQGTDTLVLSFLELHLSILHITAVRCPPNTIDR